MMCNLPSSLGLYDRLHTLVSLEEKALSRILLARAGKLAPLDLELTIYMTSMNKQTISKFLINSKYGFTTEFR